jgi:superfamily II DNA or RNA helicase
MSRRLLANEEVDAITNARALQLKKELAEEFRRQLTLGMPTNADEAALRRLANQLRQGKVVVKLFLSHPLHAKLYLLYRNDRITPTVGYLGSSNLTLSGLANQGELNVDVVDSDATQKLEQWFNDRWEERFCLDITAELAQIIDESWAGEKITPPYHVYLKMAYHLSRDAREGLAEFTIPRLFADKLFDFQKEAVQIAARRLNRRNGVLIGDVVGLGKTIMATAVAKIFEEDFDQSTLILCPKNLVPMWEFYREEYGLTGKVLSLSRVLQELPNLRRYRLVLIDESHNLRNRAGQRYRVIREYIERNESRCILLTATPYNKTYLDLASQLRLFLSDETDLGIRPEELLRQTGEIEFNRQHNVPLRSLAAFERSPHAEDWRDLMSLYMVRRTRSFIQEHYADFDPERQRHYLTFADGTRQYFPARQPRRVNFVVDDTNTLDQYACLYAADVVDIINNLRLPRYGLGNYVRPNLTRLNAEEQRLLENLSRAGRRLMGFSRTNLFKRLESSGYAFLLSVERHILRNYIYLHALETGQPLPIGSQNAELLDTQFEDEDVDSLNAARPGLFDDYDEEGDDTEGDEEEPGAAENPLRTPADFRRRAAEVYGLYRTSWARRFKWLRPALFTPDLKDHLAADAQALTQVLAKCGEWDPARDAQLDALQELAQRRHPDEKLLIFSQFADTVRYLARELKRRGISQVAAVTGGNANPTALAWRFSPVSNGKRDQIPPAEELRLLLATDVLSEGQNLQDAAIVVNYDLPWAIIRLIQRAGRVDRIGQQAQTILCYTFWPAEGIERLINLRGRLLQRLRENGEVVGTDEAFFEDAEIRVDLHDLYHERAGVLDGDEEGEVDLVSYAHQIWKNATDANPELLRLIPRLPAVTYATKSHAHLRVNGPPGALVYIKTGEGVSALAWLDETGQSVTHSQRAILDAAACALDEPGLPRQPAHHELVAAGVRHILNETSAALGGQLGQRSSARFRTYERLRAYLQAQRGTLFENAPHHVEAREALDLIYRHPLTERARDTLNRQLRSGVRDEDLCELVVELFHSERLCVVHERSAVEEPEIICSLGIV